MQTPTKQFVYKTESSWKASHNVTEMKKAASAYKTNSEDVIEYELIPTGNIHRKINGKWRLVRDD